MRISKNLAARFKKIFFDAIKSILYSKLRNSNFNNDYFFSFDLQVNMLQLLLMLK